MKKVVVTMLLTLVFFITKGQIKVSGTVTHNNEEVIGATIYPKDSVSLGTTTDVFGNYELNLPNGRWAIVVSYIGLESDTFVVTESMIKDIVLKEQSLKLEGVTIVYKKESNEVTSIIDKRKSVTVDDAISTTEIERVSGNSATNLLPLIKGTSVEDGNFVVVRGLGDRYSITQLNDIVLPSTDPYRNSVDLDVIPSFVIENIVTTKTFSPNLPGNFTGGSINVKTKSYPSEFYLSYKQGLSYNSISNLRNIIINSDGRELPERYLVDTNRTYLSNTGYILAKREARNGNLEPLRQIDGTRELNSSFLEENMFSPLNYSTSLGLGNRLEYNAKNTFGYSIALNYRRNYDYYSGAKFNRWEALKDGMIYKFDMSDERGGINSQLNAFTTLSWERNHATYKLDYLNTNINDRFARIQEGYTEQLGNAHLYTSTTQGEKIRSLNFVNLSGEHDKTTYRINWNASYTKFKQNEPDLRFYSRHIAFENDEIDGNEDIRMDMSSYGLPNHFFRYLNDDKFDLKLDISKNFSDRVQLMVGGLSSLKLREFSEYRFKVAVQPDPITLDENWDEYFNDFGVSLESPYTKSNFYEDDSRNQNIYTGREFINSFYTMLNVDVTENLKLVTGVRGEQSLISVVSADSNLVSGHIDTFDILPSVNLIYNLGKSSFRASYSKTLARPNMREMAPFFSFDFLGGFLYSGNSLLQRSVIYNYDIGWEYYPNPGELVSVNAFYKQLNDPIVKVFSPVSSTGEIKFENVAQSSLYGLELEVRKRLNRVWSVSSNLCYTYSAIEIPQLELESYERNGIIVNGFRPLQGQSPILFNAGIFYKNDSNDINSSLTFNYFSKRLFEIGGTGNPDLYEMGRPMLNYKISKDIKKFNVSLSINNILNTQVLILQEYRSQVVSEDYIVEQRPLGVSYGLSIKYTL